MKRLSLLLVLALFSCSKEPVMYDVTTSVTEGGTVSPQSGSYEEGSTVTITATPSTEYEFTKWSNGSTQNPLVLTVTSDLNIQATFTKKQYELNISKEGEGTVSERVINTGKGYDSGTKVELTAVPAGEWVFAGWSGDFTSNDNPIQVTISSPKNIKAKFVKRKYPLTINIDGEGTVTEEIVNTGRTTEYDSGTTVRLTAQPSEGWKFEKWIGDIESTDESIEMNIVEPLGVTAIFIKQSNQVSITIIGNGKINNIIEDYSIELVQGETVELAALSINDQSIFLGWSGDVLTSSNPLILSTETNMNLTANFLSKDEIQGLVITGQGEIKFENYVYDEVDDEKITGFNVSANPNTGYSFRGWNGISTLFYGGVEESANPIEIDLTKRLSNGPLVAFFVPNDGNYEQIKTLHQLLEYPLNTGVNEILEGIGGAAAGAAYFENDTGKYIIFMPNYSNNIVSNKDDIPRMGASIYRYEQDGWHFFKIDNGIQAWSIRNTEVIDNKYIISGDGNEIGQNAKDWSGDLFFGEINGENISWTRVTSDNQMMYFHGAAGGDLNGDGLIDLGGTGSNGLSVFIQTSPGVFELFENIISKDETIWNEIGGNPFAWDFADLDNDGLDEIIMADYGGEMSSPKANNVSIWKYDDSSSKFNINFVGVVPHNIHSIKRGATKVSSEDFNNDGLKDILVVGEGDNITLEIWLNNNDGTFNLNWFDAWNAKDFLIREYFIADANADGFLDILPNTQNIGERIILEGGYPFAKRLFNPQILINNRNGTFTEYSNKRIIDYYSSFGGFSIPYINNGFLEVMSILSSNDKVYPNKNEIYIRSEVITIDLRD
jgi:hypothetical protein